MSDEDGRPVAWTVLAAVREDTEHLQRDLSKACAERDELLSTLKEFVKAYDGDQYAEGCWPLMDNAKAAIAKAEGR